MASLQFVRFKNDDLLMSENLKTEWESLSNGERTEIGLVQVDIEGHSKIKANERNLKKAKDIFSDEIERIAVAHGGKLFKWEGDGGSFMFLMRDGENFNRLVKAALGMLESMPTINEKIAAETDLKEPIHVRLSCDSGIAEFDDNPTRIAADFINSFIKNERKISLADNVCITERVYKQLDTQLRTRFSLYKHSHEIRSDIYSLPRHKSPSRWKHVVLLLLLGMVLGLLCGAILAYFNRVFSFHDAKTDLVRPQNTVYMLGSGTVFRYLTQLQFFERRKDVQVLEGSTGTGARLFAGTSETEKSKVLVMAAEKLSLDTLQQYTGQPGAIYEVYLGADAFQVLFTIRGERRNNPSDSDRYFLNMRQLTFEELHAHWRNDKYDIYIGDPDSGTRKRWERYLFPYLSPGVKPPYPSEPKTWDIRIAQILNLSPESNPRIHLGSEVLNADQERIITSSGNPTLHHNRLTIIDKPDGKEVRRGLYLYGWINTDKTYGKREGYYLPKPVVAILKSVFDSLEGQKKYLDPACLDQQREYFHLKPHDQNDEGWVSIMRPDNEPFYRPVRCEQRVD